MPAWQSVKIWRVFSYKPITHGPVCFSVKNTTCLGFWVQWSMSGLHRLALMMPIGRHLVFGKIRVWQLLTWNDCSTQRAWSCSIHSSSIFISSVSWLIMLTSSGLCMHIDYFFLWVFASYVCCSLVEILNETSLNDLYLLADVSDFFQLLIFIWLHFIILY